MSDILWNSNENSIVTGFDEGTTQSASSLGKLLLVFVNLFLSQAQI